MVDITNIWYDSHRHLRPFSKRMSLPAEQLQCCPVCGCPNVFDVLADLHLYPDKVIPSAEILYCSECDSYHLQPELEIRKENVRAVDARLWSREPVLLDIEITTRCNYNCWYCLGRHVEQTDIEEDVFYGIINNAENVPVVSLAGEGEPMLHKDFFRFAEYARDKGHVTASITNGSLFTPENIAGLCQAEMNFISVSIDSTDPEQFSIVRKNGQLMNVLAGMARLREFRDRNGYNYPKIAIKGTIVAEEENSVLEIVQLAREHGAEYCAGFQPLNPKLSYVSIYPEEQKSHVPSAGRVLRLINDQFNEISKLIKPISTFFAEEGVVVESNTNRNRLRDNCDVFHVFALTSGHVTSCCQERDVLANSLNLVEMSLADVLNSDIYENLRFNLWNGIFPETCAGCLQRNKKAVEL